MYLIYEKQIEDDFAGHGVETIITDDEEGRILAHVRGWDDPTVIDDDWQSSLVSHLIDYTHGFRLVSLSVMENCQGWAAEMVRASQR
jgi:hypothetical protein